MPKTAHIPHDQIRLRYGLIFLDLKRFNRSTYSANVYSVSEISVEYFIFFLDRYLIFNYIKKARNWNFCFYVSGRATLRRSCLAGLPTGGRNLPLSIQNKNRTGQPQIVDRRRGILGWRATLLFCEKPLRCVRGVMPPLL